MKEFIKTNSTTLVLTVIILILSTVLLTYTLSSFRRTDWSYKNQQELQRLEEQYKNQFADFTEDIYEKVDKTTKEDREGQYLDNRRLESLENRIAKLEKMSKANSVQINNSSSSNIFKNVDGEVKDGR